MPEGLKRTPIPLQKKDWALNPSQVVLGIDPGFGSLGMAVLEAEPGKKPRTLAARVVSTARASKKQIKDFRVTNDDQRRVSEIYYALEGVYSEFHPGSVGVEAYNPFRKMGKGAGPRQSTISGWKAGGIYFGVNFWALSRHLLITAFLPMDLKKRFCGKISASKEEVEKALYSQVDGLYPVIQQLPVTKREHAADAAGHAVLVLEEVWRMRQMLGLGGAE
jgi:Holliday junction resolvasome RuvABC endonuclease subunit